MKLRTALCLVLMTVGSSCGRTAPFGDPPLPPVAPVPSEPETPPPAREPPLFVFVPNEHCVSEGTESDLAPAQYESLAIVRFRFLEECSGAGGEWLVGRDVEGSRTLLAGDHTCYFVPEPYRQSQEHHFAVVRFSITAGLRHAPQGWCITDEEGNAVSTDSRWKAWGVYPSEEAARAAFAFFKPQQ